MSDSAMLASYARFDSKLDAFVLQEAEPDGTKKDTHLAFCYRFAPYVAELNGEGRIVEATRVALDDMASDPRFAGATVRFGISVNQNIQEATAPLLELADKLGQEPESTRSIVLQKLAQESAEQLLVDSEDIKAKAAMNYDHFVCGYVPLTGEVGSSVLALSVLQELKARLMKCLLKDFDTIPLDEQGYQALVTSMLTTSAATVISPSASRSDTVQAKRLPIDPRAIVGVGDIGAVSRIGPQAWRLMNHAERPRRFIISTSVTFVKRDTYLAKIEADKVKLAFASMLLFTRKRSQARAALEANRDLSEAVLRGDRLVQVAIDAHVLGTTDEDIEEQATRLAVILRSAGLLPRRPDMVAATMEEVDPLSLRASDDLKNSHFLPAYIAGSVVPLLGGHTQAGSTAAGLPLRTSFGQPMAMDFINPPDCPFTLITGEAGSGKSNLVWALTSQCLSQDIPVFAVSDYTFHPTYIKEMGGELINSSNDKGEILYPYYLTKDSDDDISLAAEYCTVIASLSALITDYERCVFRSWLQETCATMLKESDSPMVGLTIPLIYERLESADVDVPAFRKGLKLFAADSEFAQCVAPRVEMPIRAGSFLVANLIEGVQGKNLPPAVQIATYVTLIAVARSLMTRTTGTQGTKMAIIFDELDELLLRSPHAGDFLYSHIRSFRASGCPVVATVRQLDAITDTTSGRELADWAGRVVCLKMKAESISNPKFRRLFGLPESANSAIYDYVKVAPGEYSNMMIKWKRGHVGLYQFAPGSFAQALWSGNYADTSLVDQRMRDGTSFVNALDELAQVRLSRTIRRKQASAEAEVLVSPLNSI